MSETVAARGPFRVDEIDDMTIEWDCPHRNRRRRDPARRRLPPESDRTSGRVVSGNILHGKSNE